MEPNMEQRSTTRPASLARYVEIETPEGITLRLELAGFGSRVLAAVYDGALVLLLLFLTGIGFLAMAVAGSVWVRAVFVFVGFGIVWGYFALFEGLWNGRTPGKRRAGIRVVLDTGAPITFQAALIRGLVRTVDYQPGVSGIVALVFMMLHPQGKRLGDLVAGTIVVRDEPAELSVAPRETEAHEPKSVPVAARSRLSDEEYRLLEQFTARAAELAPALRRRFEDELTARFGDRYPELPTVPSRFVRAVYDLETAARAAPGAARRDACAPPRLRVAERFVARNREAWDRFRARAALLEREGLAQTSGDDIVAFAGAYRRVAADLARAVTYGVDPRTVGLLERIVAIGHNALYGLRRRTWPRVDRLLLSELPAAVVRHRSYVLTALALFALPGIAGFALLRERPQVAYEVLPATMLERAASGAEQRSLGFGYAETPSPFLPIVASNIIANNVQVAFGAFAFGITAGIGTAILLVFNGLFFGAVLGHFNNVGLADWLLTFVAGHGVLELTAIFIAGGAGLLVARALIAPGDLARSDALVIHGRAAIRMVGAAACLLLVAGLIEGFVSASGMGPAYKLVVSGTTLVLLVLWLEAGRRSAAR
jgi:uncharacterized membrane protein SpoIIM required for sporulation/uncharacterized RDD family membrane protein YckC